ncbi:14599_t:CDS:2 [Dentiscutata heterogama]|uniref:14599_t:CDS:1 n=1 Tax=Dentiscutata heterogama TaxID=1316150 RepID=A0ACA9M7Y0_9GLOM|nr:14599_t:CDS:2 [Dentiscutata heterogama]
MPFGGVISQVSGIEGFMDQHNRAWIPVVNSTEMDTANAKHFNVNVIHKNIRMIEIPNENEIEDVNLPIDETITLPTEDNSALARIKKDLSINSCEGTFISPFVANEDNIQVFKDIVGRIDKLSNKEKDRIPRLEAAYYLGKLLDENKQDYQILEEFNLILKEKFR